MCQFGTFFVSIGIYAWCCVRFFLITSTISSGGHRMASLVRTVCLCSVLSATTGTNSMASLLPDRSCSMCSHLRTLDPVILTMSNFWLLKQARTACLPSTSLRKAKSLSQCGEFRLWGVIPYFLNPTRMYNCGWPFSRVYKPVFVGYFPVSYGPCNLLSAASFHPLVQMCSCRCLLSRRYRWDRSFFLLLFWTVLMTSAGGFSIKQLRLKYKVE